MSTALEIALFLASIAIIVVVVGLVPFLVHVRRTLEHLERTTNEIQSDLRPLLQETNKLVTHLDELSVSTQRQMREVSEVVETVKGWSQRADRLVNTVSDAVEPPIVSFARNLRAFQTGFSVFMDFLRHRNQSNSHKQENEHVRQ